MILKARPLAMVTAAVTVLVIAGIVWQVAKGPATDSADSAARPSASASGVVTRPAPPLVVTQASPPAVASPASAPEVATPAPSIPAQAVASAARPTVATANTRSPTPASVAKSPAPGTIKHAVEPRPSLPPIVPSDVDAVVGKALGRQSLAKFVYLEPLARRFVATVDNLGRKPAPNSMWLLRPPPGEFALARNRSAEDTSLVAASNGRRYAGFVRWVESTDTASLITLYARLYPLLQQTYVEFGHRNGYFNDRLIEVIDLMLATPVMKTPLRVQPAVFDAAAKAAIASPLSASTPPKPRFEMADPALESLATGQKMLLRVGPENAARLKLKLAALRTGLIKLGATP